MMRSSDIVCLFENDKHTHTNPAYGETTEVNKPFRFTLTCTVMNTHTYTAEVSEDIPLLFFSCLCSRIRDQQGLRYFSSSGVFRSPLFRCSVMV